MKEKIKTILFTTSILYTLVFSCLIIFNYFKATTTINLEDSTYNVELFSKLKTEASSLKESECTNIINELIEYYETTSYQGNVNIKDMYTLAMDKSPISYYLEIANSCNMENYDIRHSLANKSVNSSLQLDRIFIKEYFKYEIHIKDYFTRIIAEPSFYNQEYIIAKYNQLEIIEALIKLVKEEK